LHAYSILGKYRHFPTKARVLEASSRSEFSKRVLEASSRSEFSKRVLEASSRSEFSKRVLEASSRRFSGQLPFADDKNSVNRLTGKNTPRGKSSLSKGGLFCHKLVGCIASSYVAAQSFCKVFSIFFNVVFVFFLFQPSREVKEWGSCDPSTCRIGKKRAFYSSSSYLVPLYLQSKMTYSRHSMLKSSNLDNFEGIH
jgi:hypothetical protein